MDPMAYHYSIQLWLKTARIGLQHPGLVLLISARDTAGLRRRAVRCGCPSISTHLDLVKHQLSVGCSVVEYASHAVIPNVSGFVALRVSGHVNGIAIIAGGK